MLESKNLFAKSVFMVIYIYKAVFCVCVYVSVCFSQKLAVNGMASRCMAQRLETTGNVFFIICLFKANPIPIKLFSRNKHLIPAKLEIKLVIP